MFFNCNCAINEILGVSSNGIIKKITKKNKKEFFNLKFGFFYNLNIFPAIKKKSPWFYYTAGGGGGGHNTMVLKKYIVFMGTGCYWKFRLNYVSIEQLYA